MKKQILLIVVLLAAGISAYAQSLYVAQTSGNLAELRLSDIRKITFQQGNLVATLNGGSESTYALTDITRLYFAESGNAVKALPAADKFVWSPFTAELTTHCTPGTVINVYTAGGRRVASFMQTLAESPVSLTTLPKGVYVVESDGQSVKIVR